MSDLKPARWAEMVKLSRLRAPGATAVLSERRRLALEELIAEIERLHARPFEMERSIEAET